MSRTALCGLADGLDAASAQYAYDEWVRRRRTFSGYVDGAYSDRSPLSALLWMEIRLAYHEGSVTEQEALIFEFALKRFSVAAILKTFPDELYQNGNQLWQTRPLTPQRIREISRRVRRWVNRHRNLGLITVTVEAVGWQGLGEILFS